MSRLDFHSDFVCCMCFPVMCHIAGESNCCDRGKRDWRQEGLRGICNEGGCVSGSLRRQGHGFWARVTSASPLTIVHCQVDGHLLMYALFFVSECAKLIVLWKRQTSFVSKWTLETFTFSLFSLNDEIKAAGRSEPDVVLSVCIFMQSTYGMHQRVRTRHFTWIHICLLIWRLSCMGNIVVCLSKQSFAMLCIYPCKCCLFQCTHDCWFVYFWACTCINYFLLGDFWRPRRYNWCIDLYGCLTSPLHYYMVALVPNGLTETFLSSFYLFAFFWWLILSCYHISFFLLMW